MKQLVSRLLAMPREPVPALQRINEALLREYDLTYGKYLVMRPLLVGIYYVNFRAKPPFVDTNMACVTPTRSRTDPEIWRSQSRNFGKLYLRQTGRGGIDVCLSDHRDYALCVTIEAALMNGEEVWGTSKVCDYLRRLVGQSEKVSDKEEIARLVNGSGWMALQRRAEPTEREVYHIKRQLRRMDENHGLPLRSLIDLWNPRLPLTNARRVDAYMALHPGADVLALMRQHNFRVIPMEVRLKYRLSPDKRL